MPETVTGKDRCSLPHDTPLITTMAVGLAFLFGLVAQRLKLPLIAGYLAGGRGHRPLHAGLCRRSGDRHGTGRTGRDPADVRGGPAFLAADLMAVKAIAVPGALGQIAVATAGRHRPGLALGWGLGAALIFGLALSVASTVVLLRALQDRDLVDDAARAAIAVGWLIVEDLVMVLALVLIPPLAGPAGRHGACRWKSRGGGRGGAAGHRPDRRDGAGHGGQGGGLRRADAGRRAAGHPLGAAFVSQTPAQRELFRLSVLAIALGVAYGATYFFGVSFALGAFFAGMVMVLDPVGSRPCARRCRCAMLCGAVLRVGRDAVQPLVCGSAARADRDGR
jgi:CPA2 family monovalent cation:H+ antiporter-2